jgi:carbon storage regulator
MLVLDRTAGEKAVIGRNVSIRVVEINGNRVRLGIITPDTMAIHRQELYRHRGIDSPTERPQVNEAATNAAS